LYKPRVSVVGLIGLRDDAIEGVENVLRMYKNVAILTGDRRATALALVQRLGLPNSNRDILSATMGHLSMTIHLAAASLGLGSQRVDLFNEHAFK
jgi:magnesium-transporting ATPase (P-type)